MEIDFFPLDIDYVEGIRAEIRIFGRTLDGKRICVIDKNFDPYFWIISDKVEKIREKVESIRDEDYEVLRTEMDTKIDKGKSVEALKVYVDHPKSIPKIRKIVEKNFDIKTMEADILFVRRYLIDKNIFPNKNIKVKGNIAETGMDVDYCLEVGEIFPGEGELNNPRILSFDIETYTRKNSYSAEEEDPVISLAFFGDGFQKVITWKKFKTKDKITFVNSEAGLIEEFIKTIKEYKPDYLVGYFSDGFDFPYLIARARKYKIKLDIGLDRSNVKLNSKGMKSVKIKGICHIDIFKFIRHIMGGSLQLDNYTLNEVSKQLINDEKAELDFNKLAEMWDKNENVNEICSYNLKDAELTFNVFKKVAANLEELVKIIGVPIYDVCRMSYGQLVEWHLIRKAREFNVLVPNKPTSNEISIRQMRTYQGAFVLTPKPGLYENLAIIDFRSLYPSLINAKNIDPGTFTFDKNGSYETPDIEENKKIRYHFSYKEEGFLPRVVKELILRRERIKEMIKEGGRDRILEARSYGLKTVLNSIYGYTGYFNARFYCMECASSITAWGRHYINETASKAEESGFETVYGDTDSLVISLDKKTKKDIKSFLDEINSNLPSLMELELEDFYQRGIFVMKKSESIGAKKKYAVINEKGELKVRGFETVRRDWSYLAKEVQMDVLKIILTEGDVTKAFDYVKKVIKDIRNKNIQLEKMVIRSRLMKGISNYDQISPRVVVARRMKDLGIKINQGMTISYVIVEGSGLVRDKARLPAECKGNQYDSDYYIENQVMPSVRMIFEAVGFREGEIDKGQKSLADFH